MAGRALLMLFLSSALVPIAGGAPSPAPTEVEFTYGGPAAWQGHFEGSCTAAGIMFPPGPDALALTSQGGELTWRWARVNLTVIDKEGNPWILTEPDRFWSQTTSIPAGPLEIAWPKDGVATAFSYLPGTSERLGLRVDFDAATLLAGPVDNLLPVPDWWSEAPDGKPYLHMYTFPGWNRELSHEGQGRAEGDVIFYLRQATIHAPDETRVLEPFFRLENEVGTPLVSRMTVVYADAFLRLEKASFMLEERDQTICRSLEGRHEGAFTAAGAAGQARRGTEVLAFGGQALTLEGRFDLDEQPASVPNRDAERGRTNARAAGPLLVVGLDFSSQPISTWPAAATPLGALAALLLVAALVWKYATSFLAFLYSRLPRDRLLDGPHREAVYEAVRANPGIAIIHLAKVVPLHRTTIAYHVRVLRKAKLVGVRRQGLSHRAYALGHAAPLSDVELAVQADSRLGFLRINAQAAVAERELRRRLVQRYGLGRTQAYALVRRAVILGILRRTGDAPGVLIAC